MRGTLALFLFTAALVAACSGGTEPKTTNSYTPGTGGTGGTGGGTGGGSTSNQIAVQDNSFTPDSTTLAVGSTVTWTWGAVYAAHNVTFADGPASGNMTSGNYSRTFNTAGKYTYQCTNHTGMKGVIMVQ